MKLFSNTNDIRCKKTATILIVAYLSASSSASFINFFQPDVVSVHNNHNLVDSSLSGSAAIDGLVFEQGPTDHIHESHPTMVNSHQPQESDKAVSSHSAHSPHAHAVPLDINNEGQKKHEKNNNMADQQQHVGHHQFEGEHKKHVNGTHNPHHNTTQNDAPQDLNLPEVEKNGTVIDNNNHHHHHHHNNTTTTSDHPSSINNSTSGVHKNSTTTISGTHPHSASTFGPSPIKNSTDSAAADADTMTSTIVIPFDKNNLHHSNATATTLVVPFSKSGSESAVGTTTIVIPFDTNSLQGTVSTVVTFTVTPSVTSSDKSKDSAAATTAEPIASTSTVSHTGSSHSGSSAENQDAADVYTTTQTEHVVYTAHETMASSAHHGSSSSSSSLSDGVREIIFSSGTSAVQTIFINPSALKPSHYRPPTQYFNYTITTTGPNGSPVETVESAVKPWASVDGGANAAGVNVTYITTIPGVGVSTITAAPSPIATGGNSTLYGSDVPVANGPVTVTYSYIPTQGGEPVVATAVINGTSVLTGYMPGGMLSSIESIVSASQATASHNNGTLVGINSNGDSGAAEGSRTSISGPVTWATYANGTLVLPPYTTFVNGSYITPTLTHAPEDTGVATVGPNGQTSIIMTETICDSNGNSIGVITRTICEGGSGRCGGGASTATSSYPVDNAGDAGVAGSSPLYSSPFGSSSNFSAGIPSSVSQNINNGSPGTVRFQMPITSAFVLSIVGCFFILM